ncbi:MULTISPECIES: molybdate ABC transporter substrate-binding protein [unclassified Methylobacterium]|jgi:molybdate transport system substrate-binding protein|uniref:molybdate ABC transporter substrate-binding protein n=1 Tax=unclassified Methylobacterium TaxID=2615210 RepID=UPI001353C5D1|nr:molybdate ABC transporter substrate-binding protein [Methylobacterium sp. 2A]MWV26193.1 molybdate ABC transporter substrate-binding protein [Methylobacterium sp. 2A]
MRLTRRSLVILACSALALCPLARPARAGDAVVVFAAASLKNALDDATAAWTKATGKTARISYAGSNTLAKQIEAGAPADLFISADQAWMDDVERAGLVKPGSRIDLLRNALVLIAPGPKSPGSDPQIALAPDLGTTLTKMLGGGKLAMATIDAVPAGKYGKAALEKLGAWEAVKGQVAQADNVRAALLLVARGEAPLGIVYATDAAADPSVHVLATFPADSHPPIIYPAAVTKESGNADTADLLGYLRGPAARDAFARQGFTVIDAPAAGR